MDKQEPVVNVKQKIGLSEKPKEQSVASKDEKAVVPPIVVDSNVVDLPSEGHAQAKHIQHGWGHNGAHNFYASQAQPFYYQARRESWDMIAPVFLSCTERKLEFEKEHANGGMANIHIKATFTAAIEILVI